MKALFDFGCKNDHVTEKYIDTDTQTIECPFCQEDAVKMISCTGNLRMDGMPIHIHGDEWARRREKNFKKIKERDG